MCVYNKKHKHNEHKHMGMRLEFVMDYQCTIRYDAATAAAMAAMTVTSAAATMPINRFCRYKFRVWVAFIPTTTDPRAPVL